MLWFCISSIDHSDPPVPIPNFVVSKWLTSRPTCGVNMPNRSPFGDWLAEFVTKRHGMTWAKFDRDGYLGVDTRTRERMMEVDPKVTNPQIHLKRLANFFPELNYTFVYQLYFSRPPLDISNPIDLHDGIIFDDRKLNIYEYRYHRDGISRGSMSLELVPDVIGGINWARNNLPKDDADLYELGWNDISCRIADNKAHDSDSFALIGIQPFFTGNDERLGMHLKFARSNYRHRMATRHVARNTASINSLLESASLGPHPLYSGSFGVSIAVITSDHRILFTRRSIDTTHDKGLLDCSIAEGVLAHDNPRHDANTAPDPFELSFRGLKEELNIEAHGGFRGDGWKLTARRRFCGFPTGSGSAFLGPHSLRNGRLRVLSRADQPFVPDR